MTSPPAGGARRPRHDAVVRLGRWWSRSTVRAELRDRRLHLGRLHGVDRVLVVAALVASAVAAVGLLVTRSVAVRPSYTTVTDDWPWFVTATVVLGVVTLQAMMLRSAGIATRTTARWLFRAAYVGAALGPPAAIAQWLRLGTLVYPEHGATATVWVSVALGLFCLSVVAVAGALFLPGRRSRMVSAAVPAVVLVGEWAGVHLARLTGSGGTLAGNTDARLPPTSDLSAFLDYALIAVTLIVAGAAMAAALWGVAEAARASVDGSKAGRFLFRRLLRTPVTGSGPDPRRAWWALAAVLAVKGLWATLGIAGVLPPAWGGTWDVWDEIRGDGGWSWALAAVVAAGCAGWLLRGAPRPADGRGVTLALVAIVGVLVLPEIAFQLLSVLNLIGGVDGAMEPALRVEAYQAWAPVVACVGSLVAGGYLVARRTHGGAAILLLAFGAWSLVRCAALAVDLLRYPWFPWGLAPVSENTFGQRPGWLGLSTLEPAITVALLVVCLTAALTNTRPALGPLLLLVVVLPLTVYLTPVVDQAIEAPFGRIVAFVAPFAYLFLLDAEALNERIDRGRTLLHPLALTVLALTVGLVRGTSTGTPTAGQDIQLGAVTLVVPVLTAVVVLSSRRRRQRPRTAPPA